MLPGLFRRQLRLIIIVDGITHITTEAITIHTVITDIIIGTGPGLRDLTDIIAIGKRTRKRAIKTDGQLKLPGSGF